MSKTELEHLVDKMLEQDRRGSVYKVDASTLRDDEYQLLLNDLDKLGADFTAGADRQLAVPAPASMEKGHEILTLFRHYRLPVEGL